MKSLTFAVLLLTCTFLIGCKKEEPASPASAVSEMPKAPLTAAASIEQKTCPVMGNPIDPNVFVEYEGKKVYFCCKGCVADFQKEPIKYLDKLPQFKK